MLRDHIVASFRNSLADKGRDISERRGRARRRCRGPTLSQPLECVRLNEYWNADRSRTQEPWARSERHGAAARVVRLVSDNELKKGGEDRVPDVPAPSRRSGFGVRGVCQTSELLWGPAQLTVAELRQSFVQQICPAIVPPVCSKVKPQRLLSRKVKMDRRAMEAVSQAWCIFGNDIRRVLNSQHRSPALLNLPSR